MKSFKRRRTQIISAIAIESALYSTSLDERAMVGYFFVAQETKVLPKKIQHLVVERRSSESHAQLEYE